ncbi:hypothetical protein VMCG_03405 [Cytospora schulzeri]|uniref:Uncharacterized protein n=1 Tax=Cytospora schulzeri TaxID=448051 RepID=A0A423WWS5_9PEZI|nr:hypothetical protein VMCG_03405 [Valsa malicola]
MGSGWHYYIDTKIEALGAALPVFRPILLAQDLRIYASEKALDMLLEDRSDINRPMIPALYYQFYAEVEALNFIAAMYPFPNKTQGETSHILLTHQKVTPEMARYMTERNEAGMAYAAVITLIKMSRYRDMLVLCEHDPRTLNTPEILHSSMTATGGKATPEMCKEAEQDFHTWVAAVDSRQPDFWKRLLNMTFDMIRTRRRVSDGIRAAVKEAENSADTPAAPRIDAVTWALPAWWAASAPFGSGEAADYMVATLVAHFKHEGSDFDCPKEVWYQEEESQDGKSPDEKSPDEKNQDEKSQDDKEVVEDSTMGSPVPGSD